MVGCAMLEHVHIADVELNSFEELPKHIYSFCFLTKVTNEMLRRAKNMPSKYK